MAYFNIRKTKKIFFYFICLFRICNIFIRIICIFFSLFRYILFFFDIFFLLSNMYIIIKLHYQENLSPLQYLGKRKNHIYGKFNTYKFPQCLLISLFSNNYCPDSIIFVKCKLITYFNIKLTKLKKIYDKLLTIQIGDKLMINCIKIR